MSVKIDLLPADPEQDLKYYTVSFVSPEGLKNCNLRLLKIRGAYKTLDEAKNHASKLTVLEPYIPILVGEIGKWCPWDQRQETIKDKNTNPGEEMGKIMEEYNNTRLRDKRYLEDRAVFASKNNSHYLKQKKEDTEESKKVE